MKISNFIPIIHKLSFNFDIFRTSFQIKFFFHRIFPSNSRILRRLFLTVAQPLPCISKILVQVGIFRSKWPSKRHTVWILSAKYLPETLKMSLKLIPLHWNLICNFDDIILLLKNEKITIIMPFYDFIVKFRNFDLADLFEPYRKRDEPYVSSNGLKL